MNQHQPARSFAQNHVKQALQPLLVVIHARPEVFAHLTAITSLGQAIGRAVLSHFVLSIQIGLLLVATGTGVTDARRVGLTQLKWLGDSVSGSSRPELS
jgi:hypothetical protein